MTASSASVVDRDGAAAFRRPLMRWYRRHGRHHLPWRLTRDPYAVLVSEVMLQQTQVERVLRYFEPWLERWPTIEALASATPAEVIQEWAGMGYYRRALSLLNLAASLVAEGYSSPPPDAPLLAGSAGIGEYTTSATLCFAFGKRTVVVDTNIRRVISRAILGVDSPSAVSSRALRETAKALLPARNCRDYNLALMDLGALVCKAENPRCPQCPIQSTCAWQRRGKPRTERTDSKTLQPFELTARYARGRILRMLAGGARLSEGDVEARLPGFHRRNTPEYLKALASDGLLEKRQGRWCLPSRLRAGTTNSPTPSTREG